MSENLTKDAFLGGKLHIWQPRVGYRAGVDPVLLAASVNAETGQSVLELGCGVGTASLCLGTRVLGLEITGVELQPEYAELACRNGAENNVIFDCMKADLLALPTALRQRQFDHVMMNPPYFDRAKGSRSRDAGKDIAFGGETQLSDWLNIGIKRLAPKGYLTVIQRIDRLGEVLAALEARLGSTVVRPIAPRVGKPANLFICRARLDGKAPLILSPPLIMHDGAKHDGDKESYRSDVKAVLREGAALSMLA